LVFVFYFDNVIEDDFDVFLVNALAEALGVFGAEKVWFDFALVTTAVQIEEISVIAFFVKESPDVVSTLRIAGFVDEIKFITTLTDAFTS
jgi:hypothetical protein